MDQNRETKRRGRAASLCPHVVGFLPPVENQRGFPEQATRPFDLERLHVGQLQLVPRVMPFVGQPRGPRITSGRSPSCQRQRRFRNRSYWSRRSWFSCPKLPERRRSSKNPSDCPLPCWKEKGSVLCLSILGKKKAFAAG